MAHHCEDPDSCGVCSAKMLNSEPPPAPAWEADRAADEYFDRKARNAHMMGY